MVCYSQRIKVHTRSAQHTDSLYWEKKGDGIQFFMENPIKNPHDDQHTDTSIGKRTGMVFNSSWRIKVPTPSEQYTDSCIGKRRGMVFNASLRINMPTPLENHTDTYIIVSWITRETVFDSSWIDFIPGPAAEPVNQPCFWTLQFFPYIPHSCKQPNITIIASSGAILGKMTRYVHK